eukprot:scaffold252025_cov28-Tisochrysis_lutea.AAC.3
MGKGAGRGLQEGAQGLWRPVAREATRLAESPGRGHTASPCAKGVATPLSTSRPPGAAPHILSGSAPAPGLMRQSQKRGARPRGVYARAPRGLPRAPSPLRGPSSPQERGQWTTMTRHGEMLHQMS